MKVVLVCTVALLASSAALAQSSTPNLGRNLAATCASCHGTDGRSAGGAASLAGVPAETMIQRMREFQEVKRPATVMHQLAKGYSSEQIAVVAAYFAALKP